MAVDSFNSKDSLSVGDASYDYYRLGAVTGEGLDVSTLPFSLKVLLDDELELDDYVVNVRRMFGDARMDAVMGSVEGSVRFHGLTPTSMKLEGLDRHQRLIDSYRKLHGARAGVVGLSG